jgi:hypothetical protein
MGVTSRAVLLASVGLFALLLMQHSAQAAASDAKTTSSNVTVNVYVSISLTTDFSNGVEFSSLDPGTDNTAATTCASHGCNISVSGDSNVAVDILMKANANLTRFPPGGEMIGWWNYTWNSTDGTEAWNQPGWELNITSYDNRTAYKVGDSVAASGKRSWQAWLDIPSAQTAGTYNNTLYFCAHQEDATDCGF